MIVETCTDAGYPIEIVPRTVKKVPVGGGVLITKHGRSTAPDVWSLKKAYLPHYVYFDRTGYSGWAELANDARQFDTAMQIDADEADRFVERLISETVALNRSKLPQSDASFTPPSRAFVFMPLQLSYDTVIDLADFDFEDCYYHVRDWSARTGRMLVIKPHPFAEWHPIRKRQDPLTARILEDAQVQPHCIVSQSSIHRIIPECEAVFCINSGVGVEALLHHKPVFSMGQSDYRWATWPMSSRSAFSALSPPLGPRLGAPNTRKFLTYLFGRALVDTRDHARVACRVEQAAEEWRCRTSRV